MAFLPGYARMFSRSTGKVAGRSPHPLASAELKTITDIKKTIILQRNSTGKEMGFFCFSGQDGLFEQGGFHDLVVQASGRGVEICFDQILTLILIDEATPPMILLYR
jgi:hypothetical protein